MPFTGRSRFCATRSILTGRNKMAVCQRVYWRQSVNGPFWVLRHCIWETFIMEPKSSVFYLNISIFPIVLYIVTIVPNKHVYVTYTPKSPVFFSDYKFFSKRDISYNPHITPPGTCVWFTPHQSPQFFSLITNYFQKEIFHIVPTLHPLVRVYDLQYTKVPSFFFLWLQIIFKKRYFI